MSTFDEADQQFQREILDALWQRHRIAMNSEVGTAYFQPMFEDRINPCVTITRDDIARETKREKVRDVVLDDYAEALRGTSIEVTLDRQAKSLRVCISPVRAPEIEFKSIDVLRAQNKTDVGANPELDENPFN